MLKGTVFKAKDRTKEPHKKQFNHVYLDIGILGMKEHSKPTVETSN